LDDFSLQFSNPDHRPNANENIHFNGLSHQDFFDDIDWLKVSGCVNHQSSPAKPWLIRNNSRWKIKIRTAVFLVVVVRFPEHAVRQDHW
jgi:hypothetical protein